MHGQDVRPTITDIPAHNPNPSLIIPLKTIAGLSGKVKSRQRPTKNTFTKDASRQIPMTESETGRRAARGKRYALPLLGLDAWGLGLLAHWSSTEIAAALRMWFGLEMSKAFPVYRK